MEISFKSFNERNYLLLPCKETGVNIETQVKILTNARLSSMLEATSTVKNNQTILQYDITSMAMLGKLLERKKLTKPQFHAVLTNMLEAIKECQNHGLNESGLLFQTEHMYVQMEGFDVKFLYLPTLQSANALDNISRWVRSLIVEGMVEVDSDTNEILDLINDHTLTLTSLEAYLRPHSKPVAPTPPAAAAPAPPVGERKAKPVAQSAPPEKSAPAPTPMPQQQVPFQAQEMSKQPPQVPKGAVKPQKEKKHGAKTYILLGLLALLNIFLMVAAFSTGMFYTPEGTFDVAKLVGIIILLLALDVLFGRKLLEDDAKAKESTEKAEKSDAKKTPKKKQEKVAFAAPSFTPPAFSPDQKEVPHFSPPSGSHQKEKDSAPVQQAVPSPAEQPEVAPKPAKSVTPAPAPAPAATPQQPMGFSDGDVTIAINTPSAAGSFALVLENGTRITPTMSPYRIGRDTALVDFVLNHPTIGRFHAELQSDGDRWQIVDNNSTNKTKVNNVVIPPHTPFPLEEGDEVILAETKMFVRY